MQVDNYTLIMYLTCTLNYLTIRIDCYPMHGNQKLPNQQYFKTEMTNHYTYLLTTAPTTKQGELALEIAVREGNFDMMKYLINKCDVNVHGELSMIICRFISFYLNTT